MSPSPKSRAAFVTLELRAEDLDALERALADAYEAGASGLEECSGADGSTWILYLPAERAESVGSALSAHPVLVGRPQPVPDEDWAQRWKSDHGPIEISERLCVHPSFAPAPPKAGQRRVVIDPGAAFGTGAHESTRLALEWIDTLAREWQPGHVVLDVGTGTGVLALAALALAPVRCLAFDLDPVATLACRDNARHNRCAQRLDAFTGNLSALTPVLRCDAIVANLLRRELEPLLPGLAERSRPGAAIVLSGLLASEQARVATLARACGLELEAARSRRDASGETWIGLLMRRSSAAASRR
jgi:ribosomal protein L11 methyltransferase